MIFEYDDLPLEGTVAGKCQEKEVFNALGYIRVKPTNCILPTTYKKALEDIRNFEIRENDVFVVSNPKCGTSWCMEMVWMLATMDFSGAKNPAGKRFSYIDYHGMVSQRILDIIGGSALRNMRMRPSPRFFKSHLPKDLLPTEIWEKEAKVIYMMRDPKDATVSNFLHYKLFHKYQGNLEEFVEATMKDEVLYSPFWENCIGYWNVRNKPNLLILTLEEMKQDLDAVIHKTANFLEKDVSALDVAAIKKHLQFENMKYHKGINYEKSREEFKQKLNIDLPPGFVKEDMYENSSNMLSNDMIEKFNQWTASKVTGTGLEPSFGINGTDS